jgi:hypothetical protein
MPKYATVAIDSAGELARLYFSKDMGKSGSDMDKIRGMQNYPGTTERMQMLIRNLKGKRDKGTEIVFTAHEDIERFYAKGGAVGAKGAPPPDPYAVKGWPDIPGKRAPDEFCRAADNVLHVRKINGVPAWIGVREPIGSGAEYWEVKDRFNASAVRSGILPASYSELAALAKACPTANWQPPYIWIFYGPFGIGKTRSLLTFPRPMLIIDLDKGKKVFTPKEIDENSNIKIIDNIDVENSADYDKFVGQLEAAF